MKARQTRAFALFISIAFASALSCLPGMLKDKKDALNPFPEEMLNHRLFPIFWSGNLLGYSFRDEEKALVGPLYWNGKRSSSSTGEERTVHFTQEQACSIQAILPGISFKTTYEGRISYEIVLRGLKVHQLSHPVLLPEYSDNNAIRTQAFIASVLEAEEVIIRASLMTDKGISTADEALLPSIFEGGYDYSSDHKGIVAARNCLIGYALATPTAEDLNRKAKEEKERFVVSVFKMKSLSGGKSHAFLGDTIPSKLEEALQWIPGIDIMTERREEAKYHVTGVLRLRDSRAVCDLKMVNTYTGKPVMRASREFDARNVNEMNEFQIESVKELAGALGVRLDETAERNIRTTMRQAESVDLIKRYHQAFILFENDKHREAETLLAGIIADSPSYVDARLLHSKSLMRLSRIPEAEKELTKTLVLAFRLNNPKWKCDAYIDLAAIKGMTNDPATETDYLEKAMIITTQIHAPDSELVRRAYANIAGHYVRSYKEDDLPDRLKTAALENLVKSYRITAKNYGPDSLEAARICQYASIYYIAIKDYGRAREYAMKALRVIESHGIEHSLITADTYSTLGHALLVNRQFSSALANYQKSVDLYAKLHGTRESLDIAKSLYQMCVIHWVSSDYERAIPLFNESLAINKKIKGEKFNFETEYTFLGELTALKKDLHRLYRAISSKGDTKWFDAYDELCMGVLTCMTEGYEIGVNLRLPTSSKMYSGGQQGTLPRYLVYSSVSDNPTDAWHAHVGTAALDPLRWRLCRNGRVLTQNEADSIRYLYAGEEDDFHIPAIPGWIAVKGKKLPENLFFLGFAEYGRLDRPLHACRVRKGNVNYFGDLDTKRCVCSYATEEGCEESEVFDVLVEKAK